MPKRKLQDLNQIHGKDDFKPQTLDQILGEKDDRKYGTADVETYSQSLAEMNRSDLQKHAVGLGIIPIDDRSMLTTRLVREFKKHTIAFAPIPEKIQSNTKISKEALQILAEGR